MREKLYTFEQVLESCKTHGNYATAVYSYPNVIVFLHPNSKCKYCSYEMLVDMDTFKKVQDHFKLIKIKDEWRNEESWKTALKEVKREMKFYKQQVKEHKEYYKLIKETINE